MILKINYYYKKFYFIISKLYIFKLMNYFTAEFAFNINRKFIKFNYYLFMSPFHYKYNSRKFLLENLNNKSIRYKIYLLSFLINVFYCIYKIFRLKLTYEMYGFSTDSVLHSIFTLLRVAALQFQFNFIKNYHSFSYLYKEIE